jgi:hypothetical protein
MGSYEGNLKQIGSNGRPVGHLFQSLFAFSRHGKSGLEISSIYPKVAQFADDLCVILTCSATERCKLLWCPISETAMRPIRIVMVTPRFNLAPRVEQIEEPTNLQTLFAQPPVETFHVRVFHRLTRPDMYQLDPAVQTPITLARCPTGVRVSPLRGSR